MLLQDAVHQEEAPPRQLRAVETSARLNSGEVVKLKEKKKELFSCPRRLAASVSGGSVGYKEGGVKQPSERGEHRAIHSLLLRTLWGGRSWAGCARANRIAEVEPRPWLITSLRRKAHFQLASCARARVPSALHAAQTQTAPSRSVAGGGPGCGLWKS